jgi:hypothetical protein
MSESDTIMVMGHSGFEVFLLNEKTVRKSGRFPEARRLKKQIEKQRLFHLRQERGEIRVPAVYSEYEGDGVYHADMEYIAAADLIQFLSAACRADLDGFVERILGFIQTNLSQSHEEDVSNSLLEKCQELAGKEVVPKKMIDHVRLLCNSPVVIPVGPCHGDLTLSNILFKKESLHLIDFLDVFVESPLQDMVKLRQDTRHLWSLGQYSGAYDYVKLRIALEYLDNRFDHNFRQHGFYRSYYLPFQILNLLRIYPYCVKEETRIFLFNNLTTLIKSTN